jgi:two-component system sensor kinase FixL
LNAWGPGGFLNWICATWSMIGGMSLALGLVYLVVWLRRREQRQHLVFAFVAIAASLGAYNELAMMVADTPGKFLASARISHLTFGVAILLLPVFVRVRFAAGRAWLLWLVTATRLGVIIAGLTAAWGVHFSRLHMVPVTLPGGVAAWAPVGPVGPWALLAHFNLLLILAFLVDVMRDMHRRDDPVEFRRAAFICASIAVHVLLGGGMGVLVTWGLLTSPYLVTPSFLLPILVLSYELGDEVLLSTRERARLGRSESLLREAEEGWELAGQIAGMGPWSWDAKSDHLTLSTKARDLFGLLGEGDAKLEDWLARIHPDDAERIRRNTQQSMLAETSFERDYRILMPDGQIRWITSRGRVERDAAGNVSSMHGVSFDMSRVRRADAMFRAALEAAPDAIFLVDGEGRIQLANARASLMFGYTNEELLALPLGTLVPDWAHRPEQRKAAEARTPALERRASSRDLMARRRDGVPLPVELALSPVEGGLMLASVSDITERLLSEHESAQQRNELAHLSRVAMIGEMSSSLAHELNQPLTAIVSNSQAAIRFLQAGPAHAQELHETLEDIAASGTRAGEVIRRLRAMLKKEESERLPVDVNQLISEVVQLYRSDLINRGVTVLLLLERDLPEAIGDRVQLQQVLLNLVINACDAMAGLPGERKLTIMSRAVVERAEVEFSVWDIGAGVSSGNLERVFEPFVTTKSDGMGLGLSVCKTIVKSHGGRIWAQDNDGPGASFHVALPVATAPPDRSAMGGAQMDGG